MKKTSEIGKMAPRARVRRGLVLSMSLLIWAGAQASASAQTEAAPPAAPTKRAAKPKPPRSAAAGEAAGRYSVLREGDKDTGCMLTLDAKAPARRGNKASLAPGCRDQGIVIFDPVAWEMVGGRLVLIARKGHSTHLDQQADGTWTKDPKEGKGLILKKM